MIEKIAVFCKNLLDWVKSDRCFIKYFIDAFRYTNNNILLLSLLISAVFIVSMYFLIATMCGVNPIITMSVIILLMAAVASGLFYSVKKGISAGGEDNSHDIKSVFPIFYTGVGTYYLSFLGMFFLFFIFAILIIMGTYELANHLICHVSELGLEPNMFFQILSLNDANLVNNILANLTLDQQAYFRAWNRMFFLSTHLLMFMLMLWIPEQIYTKRNLFTTLGASVKKVVSDIPNLLCIFLTISFLNVVLTAFVLLPISNTILLFIMSIFSIIVPCYLLLYAFYVIFLYYKTKYYGFMDETE
jgi:hypothetical protein